MAGLTIEGDLTGISESSLNFIKNVLEERGFGGKMAVVEPLGKAGDNYAANVKRITVKDVDGGEFHTVAKIAPSDPKLRMMTQMDIIFSNEYFVYTKILPKFDEMLRDAGVSDEDRFKHAECYGSFREVPNEVILLEDLKDSQYIMLDKYKSLTDSQVKSVLKNLALYHALSFALKQKDPQEFEILKSSVIDHFATLNPQSDMFFTMYLRQVEDNVLQLLEKEDHKKAVKGNVSGGKDIMKKLMDADKNSKHTVILQGDAWINNIMFRETDVDGPNPVSIMIDYQQARPNNPVLDLLYMIFNCTDYQHRKDHFHDWIDFYHRELDDALSIFGLKANFLYPKDQLDADLKRYGKFGMILAVLLVAVLIARPQEATKMMETIQSNDVEEMQKNAALEQFGNEFLAMFKTRIEGVLDSFLELGLVNI